MKTMGRLENVLHLSFPIRPARISTKTKHKETLS